MMTVEELYVYIHGWSKDKSTLNWCGCGSPTSAYQKLLDILEHFYVDQDEMPRPYSKEESEKRWAAHNALFANDEGLEYLTLYWLDSLGFMEHGGAVGGGWLTPFGEEVMYALRAARNLDPQDVEHKPFETFSSNRCIHGFLSSGEDSHRHTCS